MLKYNKNLRQAACHLRNRQTEAERLLWSQLRRKQIHGLQFYRQKPLSGFIVDFYCPAANLVIELDGGHHCEENQRAYDTERTYALESLGLKVIRFTNQQIMENLNQSVVVICGEVLKAKSPPSPHLVL